MTVYRFIDTETTGVDVGESRIVQIGAAEVTDEDWTLHPVYSQTFNPGVPIPAAASAVHGITDEDVEGFPTFAEKAEEVEALLADCVIVGYNVRRFDVPLLDAELRRAGRDGVDFDSVRELDLYRVWIEAEPRTLQGALQRFGPDMPEADMEEFFHDAGRDALAAGLVCEGMLEAFDISLDEMERMSKPEGELDRFGKFKLAGNGDTILLDFGKHKGNPALEHQDYLKWMLTADFPPSVKSLIRRMLETQFQGRLL